MNTRVNRLITDVLVIGGGAAAVRAALEAAGVGVRVDLVDKGEVGSSGSSPACLSGFAATFDGQDSPERFIEEWSQMSGGVSDRNLVRKAVSQSWEAAEELEAIGVSFLRDAVGTRVLYRGAGHALPRGLTRTGPNVVQTLRTEAERRGVTIHEGRMVTKLLRAGNRVKGAVAVARDGTILAFTARAVVLAAGGANRLYPNVASLIVDPVYRTTGDGFSLSFDAGVPLVDMEFTQFRESPPGASRFGGKYFNRLGERFMERYDPRALEKAPRCTVVEAIYREMQAGRGPIIWEVAGIKKSEASHPPAKQYVDQKHVEIVIDFQRVLGGAWINEKGATTMAGLFAAGESSGGLHGGNRMQGNAFLETQVFGAEAGRSALAFALGSRQNVVSLAQITKEEARLTRIGGRTDPEEVTRSIQKTMIDQVGIVRDATGLRDALGTFQEIKKDLIPRLSRDDLFAAVETDNLLITAEMVARAALTREETRSTHIRTDYPTVDDHTWTKHVCIRRHGDKMHLSTAPVRTEQSQGE